MDKKSSDEPRLTCSEQVITSKSSLLSNLNALKDYDNQIEQKFEDVHEQSSPKFMQEKEEDSDSDSDSSE